LKKNRLITGLVLAFASIAVLLAVIMIIRNQYSIYMVMNNDGYAVSRNDMTKNLLNETIVPGEADIDATPFHISDVVYERAGNFFIGEGKTPLNDSYPLFINDSSAIMSLTADAGMVTNAFEYAQSYKGLYISDGISFNEDTERAYREEFILLSLTNGLFINAKEIIVADNFFLEEKIPVNSIISFKEKEIRYYSLKGAKYVLSSVKPLGSGSVITIDGNKYLYYDFLEKLGLYEKAALREKEEKKIKEEKLIPEEVSIPPGPSEDERADKLESKPAAQVLEKDRELRGRELRDRGEMEDTREKGAGEDAAANDDDSPSKQSELPAESAKPAEPAKPAALPEAVVPGMVASADSDTAASEPETTVDPEKPGNPGNPEWKKPVVKLGDFATTVYSIRSPGMVLENAEYLYRSGLSFEVYEGDRLVMRKAYNGSADVVIAPLNPGREYHVIANMSYLNRYNVREDEKITEVTVHTKPFGELIPLALNWSNGDIYYDKIKLKDLKVVNAIKESIPVTGTDGSTEIRNSYIETVQYMSRAEVVFFKKRNSSKLYTFSMISKDLNDFRTGKPVLYETMTRIFSDTEYEYEFICYDQFGNILPMEGVVRGETHTCKKPPAADITMIRNEVSNIEVGIHIDNVDDAEILENSMTFTIYDMDDNLVSTTITRKGANGSYLEETESGENHLLKETGEVVKFLDLMDHEIYKIKVFCSYNINDDAGVCLLTSIGEARFTTMPISALGYAFFDVSMSGLTDHGAQISVKPNRIRTDSRLIALISDLDIGFLKEGATSGAGIHVTYRIQDQDPDSGQDSGPVTGGAVSLKVGELERLKTDENCSMTLQLDGLDSMTAYSIDITPKVEVGNQVSKVYREVDTFYDPDTFITMKKSPVIDIEAIYASKDFIKLYGVSANDPDKAVFAYPVTIVAYDSRNNHVATFELASAAKVPIISFNRLNKDEEYTFRFFAAEYNNGSDQTTYRKNYELFYSKLADKREYLKITTRDAISGSVQLLQLNRFSISGQIDVSVKNITSYNRNVTLYPTATAPTRFNSSNQRPVKFSTVVDFGTGAWNGLQIGYSYVNRTTIYTVYLEDPGANPAAQPIATMSCDQKTVDANKCRWTDIQFFNNNLKLTGQRTVYLVVTTPDGAGTINHLWGIRFLKAEQSDDQHYYANLNATVNDANSELGIAPSYILKIYRDDVWVDTRRHEWTKNEDGTYTLRMYQVAPDKSETLVGSRVFTGDGKTSSTDIYYEILKGYHTYRFELWVNVYDYGMNLGQEEFTSEEDITGIRTEEDLLNIRYGVSKKYIVMNDIELMLNTNNITASLAFTGKLDFRGHKLTSNSVSPLITSIGYGGELKNMDFTYGAGWGADVDRASYYIVTNNYGTIRNIMITRNNGNKPPPVYRSSYSALCATNYEGGLIENFVVKLKDPFIATNNIAVVCLANRGMIRNGYIYGEPIQRTEQSLLTEIQDTEVMYIGGVVRTNSAMGVVENVYSSSNIETRAVLSTSDSADTIIGRNEGRLRNSFSAGDVFFGGEIRKDAGPAYQNVYSGTAQNTYFYSQEDYGNTNNTRIPKEILHDTVWYDRLFNGPTSSRTGQFNLDPVKMGFYPQVVWPESMPAQEFIKLPELTPEDNINIIDTFVTEQGEQYATAVLTFKNPEDFRITEIKTRWLNTEIISQDRIGDFYRVTVRLTQAQDTKYYSSYKVTSFSYSLGFRGLTRTVDYTDANAPAIPAEFYKPIVSVEQWSSIKDDFQQNYRLEADLDFQGRASNIAVMPANVELAVSNANFKTDAFSGKLDGNGHKLSFINTGDYGYVIGKLAGSVRDLTVESLTATGAGRYKGFIGRMLEDSLVDNVHILGLDAVSVEHCGGITGDARNASIINSSVHDLTIRTVTDGAYTQYIGGIMGKQRVDYATSIYSKISIMNSYVDTFSMDALKAGDCGGAGGIAGSIRAGSEVYRVYAVNGHINTVFRNAGGIIGSVDGRTGTATKYILKDYYVDVDITSVTERIGGVIGYNGLDNAEPESNGLVLGCVSTTKSTPAEVGYYFGYTVPTTQGAFRYENALLNGKLNTDSGPDVLTYNQLCSAETYEPGGQLAWDDDFESDAVKLGQGILPKLKDMDGQTLLPYQRDYHVTKNLVEVTKIESTNYSSGNLYVVRITTQHAPEITVTGATFNGLVPADLSNPDDAVAVTRDEHGTVLEYVLDLDGYYDAYYLTGLEFTMASDPGNHTQAMYLSVGIAPQYLEISSALEWNSKFYSVESKKKSYNVRITGDLDFSGYGGNAAKNVMVNHLTGSDRTVAGRKTIKGIRLTGSESFILSANGDVSYLNFDDITLTKSSADNPESINNYGIFSLVIGDIHDVGFSNIKIDAYNSYYVGIAALCFSNNYNISMSNITVLSSYGTLPAKRAVGGLTGKLSGSGGVYDTAAKNIFVSGRGYTGGIVGTQEDGRYLWNIAVENAVISANTSATSDSYVGGIAGYADISTFRDKVGNSRVSQAVIAGNTYVGGITGMGTVQGDSAMTALQKDDYSVNTEQLFVAGTGPSIGGIAGAGSVQRGYVRSSAVYGTYQMGGATGSGDVNFCNCTDSVIGSVFDRDNGDTVNGRFRNAVAQRQQYYQTLLNGSADTGAKAVYSKAIEALGYFVTTSRNNSWKVTTFSNTNMRIGGISGIALTTQNCIAANCRIGSFGATAVGGITGQGSASSYNSGPYRYISCGTQNCNIYGTSNIGGIIGSCLRAYVESCYSNSTVTASGANAGGIAGYVKATSIGSISETPYASHVYFAGTVSAADYAAGIFGRMDQNLYGTNEGWLMTGNVILTAASDRGNFFLNKMQGDPKDATKSMVYTNSTVLFNTITMRATDYPGLVKATTAQLGQKATYVSELNYSSDDGTTSSNYTTRYWRYSGLVNAYMPYVSHAPCNNYNLTTSAIILMNQEGYVPNHVSGRAMVDANGYYMYRYQTYNGGVPIPGTGAGIVQRVAALRGTDNRSLPPVRFYTVDADEINLEFEWPLPSASFKVYADGQLCVDKPISERTFTLNYDFKTELEVVVTDGRDEVRYNIWPEDVRRDVMTWDSDYYYVTLPGIEGSRGTLYGQYVNMYAGHALDAAGVVVDTKTGEKLREFGGFKITETAKPIHSFEFDDYKLETFLNYSIVNMVTRDGLRLYIKNSNLSAISSTLPVIADSIILDSYNGNEYKTVLYSDGMITDMTDCMIVLPKGFDNKDIRYMTNNLNSTSHILLVRYDDGAVAGFNYITGEQLGIDSPRGTATKLNNPDGIADRNVNGSSANFKSSYIDALEFGENLTASGWAEVNGVNADSGDAVSGEDGRLNENASTVLGEGTASGTISESDVSHNAAAVSGSAAVSGGAAAGGTAAGTAGTTATSGGTAASSTPATGSSAGNTVLTSNTAETSGSALPGVASGKSNTAAATPGRLPGGIRGNDQTAGSMDISGTAITDMTGYPENWDGMAEPGNTTNSGDSIQAAPAAQNAEKPTNIDVTEDADTYGTGVSAASDGKLEKPAVDTLRSKPAEMKQDPQFIPVYDAETGRYVLYDEHELLTSEDEKLESMELKVERSGHMIEYRAKQRADIKNPGDSRIYGYLLLAAAISIIALLLGFLILKKHKEAVQ
jgi:hypothetical protein